MSTEIIFWLIAAVIAAATCAIVITPLMRDHEAKYQKLGWLIAVLLAIGAPLLYVLCSNINLHN
jgi:cytochrome c-type biogenesis protein CcmH/NrfG